MKLRNVTSSALHVPDFGAVVEPDEVVEVPEAVAAAISAGEQLVDLSSWAVVEGDVPPTPSSSASSSSSTWRPPTQRPPRRRPPVRRKEG